jgi:hypothetical protein
MSKHATRWVALSILMAVACPALAIAGARAVIGDSWSVPHNKLQSIIDATYGPGHVDVQNDYLGARPGDPDQIVWMISMAPIMQVREISGADLRANVGWYLEAPDGQRPVIDGREDAPIFRHSVDSHATIVLQFGQRRRSVGFYLQTPDAGGGEGPRTLFTNRTFNDVGPGGAGALHEPTGGGDIQALVFDVSPWTRPLTWLVCFESRDSGAQPGPCCDATDNDYADYVFEVRAEATTPALAPSFGSLKALYHD